MDVRGIDNQRTLVQRNEPEGSGGAVSEAKDPQKTEKTAPETQKQDEKEQPFDEKEQQQRMSRLQKMLKNYNVEISYNDDVNRYAIKVLDPDSKEVVKEIPSEKSLEMFAKMLEVEGLLVDEKR